MKTTEILLCVFKQKNKTKTKNHSITLQSALVRNI